MNVRTFIIFSMVFFKKTIRFFSTGVLKNPEGVLKRPQKSFKEKSHHSAFSTNLDEFKRCTKRKFKL